MSTDEWTKEKIVGGLEWAQSTLSSLDRKPTAQSDECSLLVQQATHCERPPAVAASFGTKQCTWASVAVDVLYAIDRLHSECALANLARSSIDIIPSRSLRCVRIRFPERNKEFSMFERRQKDVNKIVEECRCSLVHSLDAIQYQLCIKHMWLRALLPQHFFRWLPKETSFGVLNFLCFFTWLKIITWRTTIRPLIEISVNSVVFTWLGFGATSFFFFFFFSLFDRLKLMTSAWRLTCCRWASLLWPKPIKCGNSFGSEETNSKTVTACRK